MNRDTGILRCLVVDDEVQAHRIMHRLISSFSWLELTGSCYNVPQALDMIIRQQPDIIFLDVQMPGLTGLDLLQSLPQPRPHIILTSAHKEYALDGFEHEVSDFLLKPIPPSRFLKAVLKVCRHAQLADKSASQPPTAGASPQQTNSEDPYKENIWVRVQSKIFKIPVQEVYALTALKDYVKVFFKEGILITYGTLSSMQEKLPKESFVRIHRSHLINRNAVKSIDGNVVTLINGTELSISGRGIHREAVILKLTREQR